VTLPPSPLRPSRPPRPLSVAPMIDYSDRHFRWVLRQLTRRTLLYSEMLTTHALENGDAARLLAFDPTEKPVALQLGGDDPAALARCAALGEAAGYDEVDLNVGCPSDRVQRGRFGACLMAQPELVGRCLAAMQAAVSIPVTVKHRIGIDAAAGGAWRRDRSDDYPRLRQFVDVVADQGCRVFIVHARIAVLSGLSPKQNRKVPPLCYDDVYRLKSERRSLTIEINGGIGSLDEVGEHRLRVDGAMLGRAAIDNPFIFAAADRRVFDDDAWVEPTRREVAEAVRPYLAQHVAAGGSAHHVLRHLLGLLAHQPGNKVWRRALAEEIGRADDPASALGRWLDERADRRVFDARP
jgi:tRNA-dihydrouridine synthase A